MPPRVMLGSRNDSVKSSLRDFGRDIPWNSKGSQNIIKLCWRVGIPAYLTKDLKALCFGNFGKEPLKQIGLRRRSHFPANSLVVCLRTSVILGYLDAVSNSVSPCFYTLKSLKQGQSCETSFYHC
jgi:hypothetical protein